MRRVSSSGIARRRGSCEGMIESVLRSRVVRPRRARARAVGLAVALMLGVCAVSGCAPETPEDVRLAELQDELLTRRCANPACHAGDTPERDLDLSEGRALDSIVNIPAVSVDGAVRVIPGRPEDSLLYQVTGSAVGSVRRMPIGSELSTYERSLLRVWIEEGCR